MRMRSSLDFCIERFNKTHFKSDGKIFVLEEYFNAEPVNSPNGEWQLFQDALKLDLKDNGSLLNSWSNEPGESLLMTHLSNIKDSAICFCMVWKYKATEIGIAALMIIIIPILLSFLPAKLRTLYHLYKK